MKNNNNIQFNFSYYALNLLGKQMYSNPWNAISELVANGLDAGAKNVYIFVDAVDKNHINIEILDNGSGMDYQDLAEKYVVIGRNKRENMKGTNSKVKGRKGVGKLAALFLSPKYYIITKKKQETAWYLDSVAVNQADIPTLEPIDPKNVNLQNTDLWNSFSTGTIIKLTNVNIYGFGDKTAQSLKAIFANFYKVDGVNNQIQLAYITQPNQPIKYEPVKKHIAYNNFFAFFETPDSNQKIHLANEVFIRQTDFPEVPSHRQVVILDTDDIKFPEHVSISGVEKFVTSDKKEIELPYKLEGWIGIHSTLKNHEEKNKEKTLLRNNIYRPNALRLYIRDKLAVEDFLMYINNTQAFANYIEGEISFDILDDDRLEDISTTNRESISTEDERVTLLIQILKPIVNRLISIRVNIGKTIKDEELHFQHNLDLEKQKKLEYEREKKKLARQQAQIEKEKREKAEAAEKAALEKQKQLAKKNKTLKNQNDIKDILLKKSDPDKDKLLAHELTGIANQIYYTIDDLVDISKEKNLEKECFPYFTNLKKSADKLTTIKKQFLKLNNYDIIGKQTIDLKSYLRSYFKEITIPKMKTTLNISATPYIAKVEIFELGVLLDNIVSNAQAKKASHLEVIFDDEENLLEFITDTTPNLDEEFLNKIFELGISEKSDGTGIGMYLIKEICENFNWSVSVTTTQNPNSFKITIKLGENI